MNIVLKMECIKCNGKCVKNGKLKSGKQQHKCKECGKQFTENAEKKYISQEEWELVDRLLLERVSIAGISRVTNISETHLQNYVNKKYDSVKKIADPDNISECNVISLTSSKFNGFPRASTNA